MVLKNHLIDIIEFKNRSNDQLIDVKSVIIYTIIVVFYYLLNAILA